MNALQSFIRLVLTLFLFTASVFSQKSYAQYTETFETATAGTSSFVNNGKKFVNNGKTFNLTSSYVGFNVINSNGLGYGPSNKFIPVEDDALGAPIGVLLSTSPTLTFTDATGLSSMATDGTGGSTEISDLDLQIFAGNKTTGNYTASTTMRWENATYFSSGNGFNGITPGPDPDMSFTGFSALIIKSSSQASNFSLKSIQMQDWGAVGPVQVAGYNNGSLVGAITVNLPSNGDGVTKNQAGELTPASFNDIDEVRIYSNTGNIWVGVNNIQIGSPVASAVPTITSATYNASTGVLAVTAADMVAGDTMDPSKLSITGQGGSYTLTSANVTASSSTAFSITLNSADKLNVNGILNKNGVSAVDATTFNLAAAASWNQTTTSAADLTSNAITVSNVTAPTITSATYNGSTGVLTITGTGLVKAIGATNDVTVSKFTITGGAGGTRTLSTTGNVEVISATSISLTLAGADIAAVNNLLNKNGTSSVTGTTYNLAAADDWNTVITDADIADLTSNAITVSNAKPTIESATYNASTGVLAVTAANMVTGDAMDPSKLSITGQGGSYTLTSASVTASSSTAFSITLNSADKLNVNGILNKNGVSAVDATVFNLAAAANWDVTTSSTADLTGNGITVSNVTAPTITSVNYDAKFSTLTITGSNFVKAIGATNDITVNKFTITGDNQTTYTFSTTGNVEVVSGSLISITLTGTDIAAVNALLNKDGTSSITGTIYNFAAADDWNTVVTGGNIADLTGNGITVSNAKPAIESATYNASTGVLAITAANMVAGDTMDASKLSITGQGGSYTLTSANVTASSSTAFSITLNVADKLNINGILNKNGTVAVDVTTFNLAAAANWNATTASTADLTSNAITVSNVTAPTITSATYNGSTGVLVITGTGLVKAIGATNDVTVSKFTITGETGATRTISTTGNVEIINATSISLTLSGADIAAVNSLLNKNGTSSVTGTTYNLAAADDWNTVITDTDIADLTNGITVSNAVNNAPTANADTYTVTRGGTLTTTLLNGLLLNDTDPEGSSLTASLITFPDNFSSFTFNQNGTFTYVHDGSATSSDSFTYRVSDGSLNSNTATVTINITTPVFVDFITRTSAAFSNATSKQYIVEFSESVTGVDASDFTLTTTGGVNATIGTPTGSGADWTVPVTSITGNGTLRLDFTNKTGVTPNVNANYTSGQIYTFDQTSPTVSSINLAGTSPTNATSVAYTVTFSEAVTGVDINDFTLTKSGNAIGNIVSVSGSGNTYTVTVNTVSGNGTLRLDLNASGTGINDAVSNILIGGYTSGNLYTIENPNINSVTGTLSALSTIYGTASSAGSFSFAAVNLTTGVTLTAPSGFELSTSLSSGYANPLTVGTAGNLAATTIYVRLKADAKAVSSPYSGNITMSTAGATDVTIATASSTVAVKSLTLALNATPLVTKTYDALTIATLVSANYSLTGIEGSDAVTVTGTANYDTKTIGTAKTITANAFVLAGADKDNYSLTTTSATTTGNITGKSLTLALNATPLVTKTYDALTSATLVSANYSLTGIQGSDAVTVTGTANYDTKTIGTAKTITANAFVLAGADKDNYSLTTTSATTTGNITSKSLTLALNATPLVTKTYDALTGATLVPANYTLTGIQGSDAVTVTGTANYDTKTIGTAKIITANTFVLAGADKDNYSLTTTSATTTGNITGKSLTLALNATPLVTKTYDALTSATLVSANYSLTGIQGSDAVTVTGSANYDNKDFGTSKTITANAFVLGGIDAGNYTLSNTSATTTGNITQTDINVIAIANHKTYGSADPLLSYSFSPELIAGDKFSGSLTRVAGEDVGDYAISIGTLAVNANYNIIFTTANLSITKSIVMVRADFKSKIYGDADPTLTYTVTGVSGTGNVFTGALARTAGENVNSYRITQGTLALNGNYQMSFEGSEFSIAPRSLVIKADDQSKYVGVANPVLTFTFSGFKTGETSSVLTKQPQISTTATTASVAGNYDITVSGAAASNYAISYQKGTLTINDINSVPTLDAIANQSICATVGERQIALNGISAGKEVGQTVTLSVSSSNAALFSSLSVNKGTGNSGTLSYRPATGAIGTATITVTLKDDGGTQAGGVDTYSRSFTITINAIPVVTITSDKGLSVAKGETLALTATGGTSYVWNNASGIVSGQSTAVLNIRPTVTTTYSVTATSATGCTSTQSITIQVTEEAVAAKPTNIMSPNGDGINDKWVIENIDLYPNNVVIVVDRSGRTIYSKKGYDNSWDATLRGLPLAEGTYYYIINYGDGKTPAKKGFITILNRK